MIQIGIVKGGYNMTTMIYVDKPDAHLSGLFRAAFPGYSGRKFAVQPLTDNHFHFSGAYWSGGSKSTYRVIHLETRQTVTLPELNTPSNFGGPVDPQADLPPNTAVVEHNIFCGKDHGLVLHVPQSNASRFLPAKLELSKEEQIVLGYTRSLKNSYGGRSNIRFAEASQDTGIKLLKKNGSITPDGRNAAINFRINWDFALHRKER